jgi:hypothetical protein
MNKGRLSRWDELEMDDKLLLVEGWARDGDTDKTIASKLNVSEVTLNKWKKEKPLFVEVLKRGKEVIDRHVENALLKRALGYKYKEITQEPVTDPDTGRDKLVVSKVITKEVQPDVTAQIFWLKNRKPKEWRDKQELEHTGELSFKVTLPKDEIDGTD